MLFFGFSAFLYFIQQRHKNKECKYECYYWVHRLTIFLWNVNFWMQPVAQWKIIKQIILILTSSVKLGILNRAWKLMNESIGEFRNHARVMSFFFSRKNCDLKLHFYSSSIFLCSILESDQKSCTFLVQIICIFWPDIKPQCKNVDLKTFKFGYELIELIKLTQHFFESKLQ